VKIKIESKKKESGHNERKTGQMAAFEHLVIRDVQATTTAYLSVSMSITISPPPIQIFASTMD